jgi:hypothetical protein
LIEAGFLLLGLGAAVLFVVCFTAGLEWLPRSKLIRGLGVIARIATYSGIAVAIWRLSNGKALA